MIEILRNIGLQDAGLAFAEGAAAIDELLRHMANLGHMEMRWNLFAARQDEAWLSRGMLTEERFQFT